jgi:ankyrin repeat protein
MCRVRWACVNCARTSQGNIALMEAAKEGHTACVQALVAANAALDIEDVSATRLFPCPVPLESPSTSKSHKHLLKLGSCAVVCTNTSCVVTVACIVVIVLSFCACTRIKLL